MMDLLCVSLTSDMSDSEIKEYIQKMLPVCATNGQGFCLSISDFDEDHRELWQIPEAKSFMKRLCDLGFISILEVSTTCPDLLKEEYKVNKLPGFGALEVWLCGTNRMGSGHNDIDQKTMAKFIEDLNTANLRADEVMKEPPYKNEMKKTSTSYSAQIPDAPHKHGFNKRWNR